ncbi:MAG TPA: zf-HC2 domain-containing protein [Gemmatimonadales bacterium]|nr:zf-HC2 domain-containing protein [Gemmatimonadales bacterium]
MTDQWTDRLSEYLDDELAEPERTALEAHLETCAACTQTLGELRRVVRRARVLGDRQPARELWPDIAERIALPAGRPVRTGLSVPAGLSRQTGIPARRRGFTFSLPELLAAGIALAVLSGGSVWLLQPGAGGLAVEPTPVASQDAPITGVRAVGTGAAARSYDAAVDDLERVLAEGRDQLDSTTVRVLEHNLALIDRAIADARRALAADSANLYLNTHLAETMRRKVDLLRQAAALVAAS